jgi:hypothetical protein
MADPVSAATLKALSDGLGVLEKMGALELKCFGRS